MLALIFLFSVVSAHLCVIQPQQRGKLDISTPASSSCFHSAAPCGGVKAETPKSTLIGGITQPILIQQNLNHYSVGSRGWIDVSLSELPNPISDDQFELIYRIPDYDAYHKYTQTNITLQITLPNITCDHCVLQFRYVSRKPTEPVFHQCVDIAIEQSTFIEKSETAPASKLDVSQPFAIYPIIGLTEAEGVTTVRSIDPTTGENQAIVQIPSYVQTGQSLVGAPEAETSYLANGVVAVNRDIGLVYYLRANTFDGIPLDLITIDVNKQQIVNEFTINADFPLNAIHYNHADGSIIAVGLRNISNVFYYVAGHVNTLSGVFTQVVTSSAVEVFVDYVWSEYDSSQGKLYILSRHEDQETSQAASFFTLDFNAKQATKVGLELNYIFTSFFIDASTPTHRILAFSPGPVDSNGDVLKPVWQIVSVNPMTGGVNSVAIAPSSANNYPVWWGGGVFGFSNDPNTSAQDSQHVHLLATTAQHFPHPANLVALYYNIANNSFTLAQPSAGPLPYFFCPTWV